MNLLFYFTQRLEKSLQTSKAITIKYGQFCILLSHLVKYIKVKVHRSLA